ncbi:hypothetical protein AALP_AA7G093000 [Arabis alpina]|nr:hypothetical protein AALP_AA7G093000 [Arabis alpina]
MRFLAAHNACLAQINPRGFRHLIGVYVLSIKCSVDINIKHLSSLLDFRVRDRSEELKNSVTNASEMALIAGFPSKDDHFEDRFFFVEIFEKTVEVDLKPVFPEISTNFVPAMHKELSSWKGIWKRSFSRKRIKRALSVEIIPRKKVSASRVAAPPVSRLLRDEAYMAAKSQASEFSLFFNRLFGDYDEDVHSGDHELHVAKEANAVLQSRLEELTEQNQVLERGASSVQKIKKDYDAKLARPKSRCTNGEEKIALLKQQLSSASDLQSTRIGEAVTEAKDEMARGFARRVSEVAGLLTEIGGKAQNNMLNLAEIDVNLEFIGLLQGPTRPDLPTEVKALRERRHPVYDAPDVDESKATN